MLDPRARAALTTCMAIYVALGCAAFVTSVLQSKASYVQAQSSSELILRKPIGRVVEGILVAGMLAVLLSGASISYSAISIIFWLSFWPLWVLFYRKGAPEKMEFDLTTREYRYTLGWTSKVVRSGQIETLAGIGAVRVRSGYLCRIYWTRYDGMVVGECGSLDDAIAMTASLRELLGLPLNRDPGNDALPKTLA